MRQVGTVLPELVAKNVKSFFRLARTGDNSEGPIGNFLFAGVPFVSPGEENSSSQTAPHHAVDVPAQHLGLLFLGMANRVHAEFAQNKRALFAQILKTQKIFFEVALIVQIKDEEIGRA